MADKQTLSMKLKIPKFGNRLNQLELQTGMPKGHFKSGDRHPIYPSLRYEFWRAWGPTPKKRREHAKRNPEGGEYWRTEKQWRKRQKEIRDNLDKASANRRYVDQYKLDQGCAVCGYNEVSYCLDLDHIDPTTKTKLNRPDRMCLGSIEELKEILQSGIFQVLCAICHRIKTFSNREQLLRNE